VLETRREGFVFSVRFCPALCAGDSFANEPVELPLGEAPSIGRCQTFAAWPRIQLASGTAFLYIFVETRIDMADTQISAHISEETREKVERYADAHGMKKGALVEQALLHHLQALRELPADVIISPRLELSEESFAGVARLTAKARKPAKAMRSLMAGKSTRER